MSDTGGPDEPFDPLIAERFRLLERLEPPADALPAGNGPAAPIPLDRARSPRARIVAATAAAAAVIVAISAAVAIDGLGGGRGGGVEAVQTADERTDGDDQREPVPDGGGAPERSSVLSVESATTRAAGSGSGPDSRPGTDRQGGSDGSEGGVRPDAVTTGSTEVPSSGDPGGSATSSGVSSTTTATTTTSRPTSTTTTDDPSTLTSVSLRPSKDTVLTIRGTVTEVFTDCVSHLVLEGGRVVSGGPLSCDGGSWIRVDGTRIRTSSGLSASNLAYNRHDPDLRPGSEVAVVAFSPGGGRELSLDCPLCRIDPA